ncbi:MAG: hypothetical protein AB2392_19620 [Neobacillus sp.]|jgi:hypothetical protein
MAGKKQNSKEIEKNNELYRSINDDRHSENARAAAETEPISPRISTDNL